MNSQLIHDIYKAKTIQELNHLRAVTPSPDLRTRNVCWALQLRYYQLEYQTQAIELKVLDRLKQIKPIASIAETIKANRQNPLVRSALNLLCFLRHSVLNRHTVKYTVHYRIAYCETCLNKKLKYSGR